MNISPAEKDYIDIHTHSTEVDEDSFRILNVFAHSFNTIPARQPVSIGLYPWYITESSSDALGKILESSAHLPQVKAIGETGLDRLCKISIPTCLRFLDVFWLR